MNRRRMVLACITLCLSAAAAVLWYASDDKPAASSQAAAGNLEEQWLAAVEAGQADKAIRLARQICGPVDNLQPNPAYARFMEANKLKADFLTAPFNKYDFQLWKHATFFKGLASQLSGGDIENLRGLFDGVVERVQPREEEDNAALWPYRIWQRGFGVCDRQAWTLCALAYQCEWETQVVYLIDPKTGKSPHTICAMRRPGGELYIADPYQKVLIQNKTIQEILADPQMVQQIYPDRPDFQAALGKRISWTPSYPQDYCPRNQLLQIKLQAAIGERCPRFGIDPTERMQEYAKLRALTPAGRTPAGDMRLWDYPIRLLASQMRQPTSDRQPG